MAAGNIYSKERNAKLIVDFALYYLICGKARNKVECRQKWDELKRHFAFASWLTTNLNDKIRGKEQRIFARAIINRSRINGAIMRPKSDLNFWLLAILT
ncbi:MAG: hypothetical protein RMK89_13755 [Armatimonadota bacterium]|nr:hypothetical protein [Armatimonadota bacterium]MCX7778548.1 hypothetical protein [Armatimonadota bacterium]MDW8144511.1 hypothetical protein [Armatimonadota bacterium]